VARAVLRLQQLLPPAPQPQGGQEGQALWPSVPAAAATFFAFSLLRRDSLLQSLRPPSRKGSLLYYVAPTFLLAEALPFSEVALAAPRLAAGGAGIAEPPLQQGAARSGVGCAEFLAFGKAMAPQLVQERATRFTCAAACVINSASCFVWAGFTAAGAGAGGAGGRGRRRRPPATGFPYGCCRQALGLEAGAAAELAACSFSSCDWDEPAGARASNWRNCVVAFPAALSLSPGDAVSALWRVDHSGAASAYALTVSVERGGGEPAPPRFTVELGDLYPNFRRASGGEERARRSG